MGSREKHTRGGSIACVRGQELGLACAAGPRWGASPRVGASTRLRRRRGLPQRVRPVAAQPRTARTHGAGMAGGGVRDPASSGRGGVVGWRGGGAGVMLPRALLGGPTSAGGWPLGRVCGRRPANGLRGEASESIPRPTGDRGRRCHDAPHRRPMLGRAPEFALAGSLPLAPALASTSVAASPRPYVVPPVSAADTPRRRPRHLLRTLPPTSVRPPCSSRLQGCSSSVLAVRVSITYFPARAARTVSPRTLPTFARPRTPPIAQILPRMGSSTAHFRLTTGVLRYLALSQNLLRRISQFPFVYSPSLCAPVSVCNFFVPHKEGARLRLQAVWYAKRRTTTVQQDQ